MGEESLAPFLSLLEGEGERLAFCQALAACLAPLERGGVSSSEEDKESLALCFLL